MKLLNYLDYKIRVQTVELKAYQVS